MGLITSGRGIVIHRPSCRNTIEFRNAPEKWVDVSWASKINREFSSEITLEVQNQKGVLATVAASCSDSQANIEGINLSERDEQYSQMKLILGVRDRKHLADVLRVLRKVATVAKVTRKTSG